MFTDPSKLKITKATWYRVNFKYDGILYSIGHNEDIAFIRRMSDKRIIHSWYCWHYNPLDICKVNGKKMVYSHIDKKYFLEEFSKLLKIK